MIRYAALFLVVVLFAMGVTYAKDLSDRNFVRGKYGDKCYVVGTEHRNIEYPIYYTSLDDCLAALHGTATIK